jgi:hypothetical protein
MRAMKDGLQPVALAQFGDQAFAFVAQQEQFVGRLLPRAPLGVFAARIEQGDAAAFRETDRVDVADRAAGQRDEGPRLLGTRAVVQADEERQRVVERQSRPDVREAEGRRASAQGDQAPVAVQLDEQRLEPVQQDAVQVTADDVDVAAHRTCVRRAASSVKASSTPLPVSALVSVQGHALPRSRAKVVLVGRARSAARSDLFSRTLNGRPPSCRSTACCRPNRLSSVAGRVVSATSR